MSVKDINFMLNAYEVVPLYQSLLTSCLDKNGNNSKIKEEKSLSPPSYRYISREALGSLMLRSKELYFFHLLFAFADLMWTKLISASTLPDASTEEILLRMKNHSSSGEYFEVLTDAVEAVTVLDLREIWKTPLPLDGEDIKKIFHHIPHGPYFKDIINSLQSYRLNYPHSSRDECIEYLKSIFPTYL